MPAAAAAVPRGMRRRVIYDPPAAPPPRMPLARTRQVSLRSSGAPRKTETTICKILRGVALRNASVRAMREVDVQAVTGDRFDDSRLTEPSFAVSDSPS